MSGIARPTAAMSVADIGTEMRRVPSAAHVVSGAGGAPGHHERAGQRTAGTTRPGHRGLRTVLVQAAQAAARPTGTSLRAQDRRLATRRGKKRAMMAVAHARLVMAYHMIQRPEPYRDAGADFVDRRPPEDTARRLVKRLEHWGYHLTLQSLATDAIL
jgi:transposase